jgi:hypothetical protein
MTVIKNDTGKTIETISKICTILIPFVLYYLGNEFSKIQAANNKEQQNFDRVTVLLKSLSSENQMEKKLAIKFSQGLADKGDFPIELISVMNDVQENDTVNSKTAQNVMVTMNQMAKNDKNLNVQKKVEEAVKGSPARVYTQIAVGYNLKTAKAIVTTLKSTGYNMLGIERVNINNSPLNNEVRYFKASDKLGAEKLAGNLSKILGNTINAKHIGGYENTIIGTQLEIWLK